MEKGEERLREVGPREEGEEREKSEGGEKSETTGRWTNW